MSDNRPHGKARKEGMPKGIAASVHVMGKMHKRRHYHSASTHVCEWTHYLTFCKVHVGIATGRF